MVAERHILLLGSGFVAGPAAEYILRRPENHITIASRRLENAQALAKQFPRSKAVMLDVDNEEALDALVAEHDVAVSLIPYIHHAKVIKSGIKSKKHVVTTSYVSPAMMEFDAAAKEAGITVMNEIGLDPGIDHLYALKTINEVHEEGGKILSFLSYCGGLPAPECSNNPLGYKFSWSSRGVLLALRNTARFIENDKTVEVSGRDLMLSARRVRVYPAFALVGYGNRDSTGYRERYNIPEAHTVLRGSMRYEGCFCEFVISIMDLGLLDDTPQDFLTVDAADLTWSQLMAQVVGLDTSTAAADPAALEKAVRAKFSITDKEEQDRVIEGFKWLGMLSDKPVTKRGTYLDVLCAAMDDKMMYADDERDMILLQHRFEVELKDGTKQTRTSTLLEYGQPNGVMAMARTVGVPCGIAVQLILDGKLTQTGVLAPMTPEINNPIMELLEKEDVNVIEEAF
ncbi:saccharopine dehydrogenase (NADP+, L-glutamate-forming) [Dimargaris verticillata]|uniref:Saccharopine dehydrogenase (NADP+, L-glutamate-forming) n=1 Tax=Dimargaris verticillata TaxID=2761393 RepID=A0A9W8B7U9_9FUNG|nr:saccharopine dehydrogenase (NADP+, L-glutamate-forming) [Dimargaris verticillata]